MRVVLESILTDLDRDLTTYHDLEHVLAKTLVRLAIVTLRQGMADMAKEEEIADGIEEEEDRLDHYKAMLKSLVTEEISRRGAQWPKNQ